MTANNFSEIIKEEANKLAGYTPPQKKKKNNKTKQNKTKQNKTKNPKKHMHCQQKIKKFNNWKIEGNN